MSHPPHPAADSELPPPIQIVWGLCQLALCVALAVPAAIMTVFPLTSALGRALMRPVGQMSYHGGANIGAGIAGTIKLIGRGITAGARRTETMLAERRQRAQARPDDHQG